METSKVEVDILWGRNIIQSDWQKKAFKDSTAALEFCRKHYDHILCINSFRTAGQPVSHFDIMCAIENPDWVG